MFKSFLFKTASDLAHRVYYHGSKKQFTTLQLDGHGLTWLAFDSGIAKRYADDRYYIKTPSIVYEVRLSPSAKIVDLRDSSCAEAQYILSSISKVDKVFGGTKYIDFGILEYYTWVVDYLKERYDGVVVHDGDAWGTHPSLGLFNTDVVASMKIIEPVSMKTAGTFVTKKPTNYFHGTSSSPFEQYDPDYVKNVDGWNPLGNVLYATDNEEFAKEFGEYIHEVLIPEGYQGREFTTQEWEREAPTLVETALHKALRILGEPEKVPAHIMNRLRDTLSKYSPWEGLDECLGLLYSLYDDINIPETFVTTMTEESQKFFSQYDFVVLESPVEGVHEVLIYNPKLQRTLKYK